MQKQAENVAIKCFSLNWEESGNVLVYWVSVLSWCIENLNCKKLTNNCE